MRLNHIAAAGTAIAIALAWATSPMAQIAPSQYTPENVTAEAPFGELPVDPATVDLANIGALLATLTLEQVLELQQRCVVITGNAATYTAEAVAVCEAVIAAAETPAM
jgi:hypothetical protein